MPIYFDAEGDCTDGPFGEGWSVMIEPSGYVDIQINVCTRDGKTTHFLFDLGRLLRDELLEEGGSGTASGFWLDEEGRSRLLRWAAQLEAHAQTIRALAVSALEQPKAKKP